MVEQAVVELERGLVLEKPFRIVVCCRQHLARYGHAELFQNAGDGRCSAAVHAKDQDADRRATRFHHLSVSNTRFMDRHSKPAFSCHPTGPSATRGHRAIA